MARRPIRPLFLLCAAALAPITLGIAMHLEHVAATQACTAELDAGAAVPSAPSEPAAPVVPHTLPIPMPMVEPASEHALPFAFVIDVAGPHIVLATDVDESWAHGEPQLRPSANPHGDPSVHRAIAIDRVPTALLANVGRTMRVYAADGEACTARVGQPVLVGELWGELDWGVPKTEDGPEDADGSNAPEPTDAEQIWERGRRLLVAPLATDGDCGTPLWARDVALPAPAVFTRADGAVPRAARRAVMRDAEVRDMALEFRRSFDPSEPELDEAARAVPSLADHAHGQRWQDARGRELFTFTFGGQDPAGQLAEHFGGCGGFDPAWAAFVPSRDAGVTALDRVGDHVLAVVDLDRDGKVEVLTDSWLGPTRLVEIGGPDALRERASLDAVPFFGCHC